MSQSLETFNPSDLKKLIDWAFQSLISWSVFWLTCFVGLIELLPEIKLHSGGLSIWLTVFLCLIYVILVVGMGYSSYRLGTLYAEIHRLQHFLPEPMKQKIHRAPHIKLILDEEGKLRKEFPLLIMGVLALWIFILIFKILISVN